MPHHLHLGEPKADNSNQDGRQRRLRWLGHIHQMGGHIPKDILYGELASGERTVGCPQQRLKDVCKYKMKAMDINTESWEDAAPDCS